MLSQKTSGWITLKTPRMKVTKGWTSGSSTDHLCLSTSVDFFGAHFEAGEANDTKTQAQSLEQISGAGILQQCTVGTRRNGASGIRRKELHEYTGGRLRY